MTMPYLHSDPLYSSRPPMFDFNYMAPLGPRRVTAQVPQNLLRPTSSGCGPTGLGSPCGCGPCGGGVGQPLNNGVVHVGLGLLSPALGLGQYYDAYGQPDPVVSTLRWAVTVAGAVMGGYHGYHRNRRSVGWGVWWGFCGSIAPILTLIAAVAQGYAKPGGR